MQNEGRAKSQAGGAFKKISCVPEAIAVRTRYELGSALGLTMGGPRKTKTSTEHRVQRQAKVKQTELRKNGKTEWLGSGRLMQALFEYEPVSHSQTYRIPLVEDILKMQVLGPNSRLPESASLGLATAICISPRSKTILKLSKEENHR